MWGEDRSYTKLPLWKRCSRDVFAARQWMFLRLNPCLPVTRSTTWKMCSCRHIALTTLQTVKPWRWTVSLEISPSSRRVNPSKTSWTRLPATESLSVGSKPQKRPQDVASNVEQADEDRARSLIEDYKT